MPRIIESALILPALYAMYIKGGSIQTTDLIKALTEILKPTGHDLEILEGRRDTKFSQKVRNLKSHGTLVDQGFATHTYRGYEITKAGHDMVEKHKSQLELLFEFQFFQAARQFRQLADSEPLEVIDEKIIVEGKLRQRSQEYHTRSRELRLAAVEHYAENGRILCAACEFEFALAYPGIGDGYIEIHHLRPVSYMRGEPLRISEALGNVRPLCANCHRMIHTSRPPRLIEDIRRYLKVSYSYGDAKEGKHQ